jgi:hypothetical protein
LTEGTVDLVLGRGQNKKPQASKGQNDTCGFLFLIFSQMVFTCFSSPQFMVVLETWLFFCDV